MSKGKICIDAGHGFNTPGKRSCPFVKTVYNKQPDRSVKIDKGVQLKEHCANAATAEYLEKELIKRGYEVYRSGYTTGANWRNDICPENPDDDVKERQSKIRHSGSDLCISIHFNAHGDGKTFDSASGIETYYREDKTKVGDGKRFAEIVHKHVKKVVPWQTDRGVKSDNFGMCNSVYMQVRAAVIVELAFMTNRKEAERIFSNPWCWKHYALVLADAVDEYMA